MRMSGPTRAISSATSSMRSLPARRFMLKTRSASSGGASTASSVQAATTSGPMKTKWATTSAPAAIASGHRRNQAARIATGQAGRYSAIPSVFAQTTHSGRSRPAARANAMPPRSTTITQPATR